MNKQNKKEKFMWTRKDTAELFHISVITLDQWKAKGCPHELVKISGIVKKQKRFYIPDVIDWRASYAPVTQKHEGLQEEKARLAKEQADGQALKNRVTRKEIVPIKLLEYALTNVCEQISSILESIPLKVKKNLPKLTASEIEVVVREVNKASNAASKIKIDYSRSEEAFK